MSIQVKKNASKKCGNSDVASRREDTLLNKNMDSASAKKLNAFGIDSEDITEAWPELEHDGKTTCYSMIQESVLESMFIKFLCPIGKEPGLCLELSNEDSYSFAKIGKTYCSHYHSFTDN